MDVHFTNQESSWTADNEAVLALIFCLNFEFRALNTNLMVCRGGLEWSTFAYVRFTGIDSFQRSDRIGLVWIKELVWIDQLVRRTCSSLCTVSFTEDIRLSQDIDAVLAQ